MCWYFNAGRPPLISAAMNDDWDSNVSVALSEGDLEALRLWLSVKEDGIRRIGSNSASRGRNMLHEASSLGHESIVRYLLSYNININKKTTLGRVTALHLAADQGHNNIVRVLVHSGADVNAETKSGERPLHLASTRTVVQTLILNGADTYAKTRQGLSPSQTAAVRLQSEVYDAIQQHVMSVQRTKKLQKVQIVEKRKMNEKNSEAEKQKNEKERFRNEQLRKYEKWRLHG